MSVGAWTSAAREKLSLIVAVLTFLITVPLMYPFARIARGPARPWVISGHRGRIYADNAAAVHRELMRQGQPVIWISADPKLAQVMRDAGAEVRIRHSLRARWAMLSAPVLIYSHGESDIDLLQILLRRCLGLRVYVNHCMNHVKAGQRYSPVYDRLRGLRRWFYEFLITDFDVLLASSESEKYNFELGFSDKKERIRLGGGAHMDAFIEKVARGVKTRDIVYFPTFRDDASGREELERVIQTLASDPTLAGWLEENDLRLRIGAHINTGAYKLAPAGRVEWLKPSEIVDAMCTTRAFISDYSGLLADSLLLDIPVVFFPFDLEDYLSTRRLYHPYERLAFGPVVRTPQELVALLTSGAWENLEPYAVHRKEFGELLIPNREPSYAASSVAAIYEELEARAPQG